VGAGKNTSSHRTANPENGDNYYIWLDEVLSECRRVSPLVVMFNSSTRMIDMCRRYQPKRILIWDKIRTMQAYRYEPIFIFLGKLPTNHNINRGIYNDCLKFLPVLKPKTMYENPTKLYSAILKYFPWVESVLDPFMGSGTTAEAAKSLGINFLGFEIEQERVRKAEKRLQQNFLHKEV